MVDTERAWTIYVIVVGVFVGIVAVASALIVLHRLVSPDAELANIYEWCYEGREIKSSSQLTDFDIERAINSHGSSDMSAITKPLPALSKTSLNGSSTAPSYHTRSADSHAL